jgi:RHS repeat-associated protein
MRLTSVTHGGLAWRYEYDTAGRLVAQSDYNGAVTEYAYDAAGQLTSRTNAAGQQVSYAYDLLGNMTERHADGVIARFGYDLAGRLVQAADPGAVITLERDACGLMLAETCNGRTVRSGYDPAGRLILRVTPSGAQARWSYDAAGQPVAVSSAGNELLFGYDLAGRETLRQLTGGVTLTQEWDPAGQLASQVLTGPPLPDRPDLVPPAGAGPAAGRLLQRRSYSYRADGILAGLDDLLCGPRRLALDLAGRVTGVTGPDWAESYGYDPAGNITTASWPAPAETSGAQGPREYAGTLITRAGDIRYQHDDAGRIIVRQHTRLSREPDTWHYQWDAEDRLTAVTTPDGTRWQYRYDPLGRRIAKQRLGRDGQVTSYTTFSWRGPLLVEQSASGGQAPAQLITWDYQPGTFIPVTQTERWQRTPQDQVDERFYAIVTDLIGTPSELITPDGKLAGYRQQTLWGTAYWTSAVTPLRFPGQYADDETGLHYNHYRYYDPATGRYLTPDPLGLAAAANPHTYVPNPTALIDPHGLMQAEGCGPPARVLDIGGGQFKNAYKYKLTMSRTPTPKGILTLNNDIWADPDIVGQAQQLPFRDSVFDRVTFSHLPYYEFYGTTLPEVARVTKPGGTLFFAFGSRGDVSAITYKLQDLGYWISVLRNPESGGHWVDGVLRYKPVD